MSGLETTSNSSEFYVKLIPNSLLCYATTYMSSCTKEHLSKTLYQYYNNEELLEAKQLLYSVYDVLGPVPVRRSSAVRPERQAHADDIVEALFKLDVDHSVEFEFGVKNVTRLPKWEPNVFDMMSLVEKVSSFEARLNNVEYVASENKAEILQSKQNIDKLERKSDSLCLAITDQNKERTYATAVKSGDSSAEAAKEQKYMKNRNILRNETPREAAASKTNQNVSTHKDHSKPETNAGIKSKTALTVALPPPDSIWEIATGTPTIIPSLENGLGTPLGTNNDQFVFPPSRKKRKIVQRSGNSEILRGGPLPQRDFFVYRAEKSVTCEIISQHLRSNSINPCKVEVVSHAEAKFKSFKVKVNVSDAQKIMNPDIWPSGIYVRKFFPKQNS